MGPVGGLFLHLRPINRGRSQRPLCSLQLKWDSKSDGGYDILRAVIKPSLLIQGNEGRCSLCPELRFIAGAENETISLIKQFEAHCRKSHKTRDEQPLNKKNREITP